MVDKISKAERSRNMAAIKNKNTSIELVIRKALHKRGFRYKIHNQSLSGKPDLVLPKYESVIFVHGCFWHGHQGCKIARIPKSNTVFWNQKIINNKNRDTKNINVLLMQGWRVLILWECAFKKSKKLSLESLFEEVEDWILGQEIYSQISA